MAIVQVKAAPLQAPLQPLKTEPCVGTPVKTTELPVGKLALQLEPQLIPLGLLVTDPGPVAVTVN